MRVAAAVVVVAVAACGPNAAFAQTEEPRFLISASAGFQPGDQAVADDGKRLGQARHAVLVQLQRLFQLF